VDGVSPNDRVSSATLESIRGFARAHPAVYLPTHDPHSAARLADRRLVDTRERIIPQEIPGLGDRPREMVR
jgi:hypothetical protein